jgi:hypothetical protein
MSHRALKVSGDVLAGVESVVSYFLTHFGQYHLVSETFLFLMRYEARGNSYQTDSRM